ncbi:MAG: hypothetical protein B7Y16_09805 [Methylotenera sp. 24-45-7]|nr:MAG: hypothetical protein B7Y16_09805 [Methylotenera sp. 24-45-7]OYZ71309.1 MAG: hypothetical protein B7X98_00085 [Methylophilaceae bacterium 17-43-7]
MKNASEDFIKLAEKLDEESAEKILSRMTGKLPKRFIKEKLTKVEAIALQLELEDELLQDWRKNFAKVNSSDDNKKKKDKP